MHLFIYLFIYFWLILPRKSEISLSNFKPESIVIPRRHELDVIHPPSRCTSLVSVDTGGKLNVHKTFIRRPGRLLNVLCTFNLRPVSTEAFVKNRNKYINRLLNEGMSNIYLKVTI